MGFDDWLFGGDPEIMSRTEKASGYFLARQDKYSKFMVFWRISCLIFVLVTEVHYWFIRLPDWGIPVLFVTNQSHYLYGIFNLLTLSAYIRYQGMNEPLPADSNSPWLLWKWVSILFNLLMTFQLYITIGFWIGYFFFYTEEERWEENMFNLVAKHGAHYALLLIDAGFNKI